MVDAGIENWTSGGCALGANDMGSIMIEENVVSAAGAHKLAQTNRLCVSD